jgi:5'-deoxynucleotidase YfbR-like HD superfamily hydrolase
LVTESGSKNTNISKDEKHSLECEAFNSLFKGLKNGDIYIKLWEEYEQQKTKEAMVLKQLDNFVGNYRNVKK